MPEIKAVVNKHTKSIALLTKRVAALERGAKSSKRGKSDDEDEDDLLDTDDDE